jgi:hypothetical protein
MHLMVIEKDRNRHGFGHYENNCVLDLNVEPFEGPPYRFIIYIYLILTLIYPTLNPNLCLPIY